MNEPENIMREELDPDSGIITVYACPACGNPDRDDNAAYMDHLRKLAEEYGWKFLDMPLHDWFKSQLDRVKELEAKLTQSYKEG